MRGFFTSLLVLSTALVGVGACAAKNGNATTGAPASAAARGGDAAGAAPSGPPVVYAPVDNLCSLIDPAPLTAALGPAEASTPSGAPGKWADCTMPLGTGPLPTGSLQFQLQYTDNPQMEFDGLRGAHQHDGSIAVASVPGVGSGAYAYKDPQTGPHVVAYDGNVYMEVGFVPAKPDALPADVVTGLKTILKATIAKLPKKN